MRVIKLFDRAVVVVNRDNDLDRISIPEKRLNDVGIPFELLAKSFTDREKYRWHGMHGTNASSLRIVQAAKDRHISNVLIMEDDMISRVNFLVLWFRIVLKLKRDHLPITSAITASAPFI